MALMIEEREPVNRHERRGAAKLIGEPPTHTTSKPTYRLRWVPKSMLQAADLKLQQAWETVHYDGRRPARIETEWRDVPIESED